VAVPSLFILGEADALVPPERTLALLETFDRSTAEVLRHPGAHMVPTCSGEVKRQIVEFLDRVKDGSGEGGGEGDRGGAGGEASGEATPAAAGGPGDEEQAAAVVA
jgi:hypothetical protein